MTQIGLSVTTSISRGILVPSVILAKLPLWRHPYEKPSNDITSR